MNQPFDCSVFFNTRPKERAKPLSTALSQHNIEVIDLPLLELEHLDHKNDPHIQAMQHAWQAGQYDALVVVSPTAGELGLAHCPSDFVPQCPVVAVGNKTATVLQNAGWQVVCPAVSSNEGMMQLPELARLGSTHRVLIWRGLGGRRLLVEDLQRRGVWVDSVAWYARRCPPDLTATLAQKLQRLQQYKTHSKPTVLISSGESWQNWQNALQMLAQHHRWTVADFDYVVLGERLSNLLKAQQICHITVADLSPAHIVQALL